MFPDYVAYLAAQRRQEIVARSALPAAPVEPGDRIAIRRQRLTPLRAVLCAGLRRLADRIEPASQPAYPLTASGR